MNTKLHRLWGKAFGAIVAGLIISCASGGTASSEEKRSFAFQLQDVDLDALAASSYKTVVIDYSSDGTDAGRFTAEEIADLKASGKTVLAYLSIGEAEAYRWYWESAWNTSPPAWLGKENPDWEGNYKVRYWHEEWQALLFNAAGTGSLDKILDAGFDGVYLDIVDAYWYWGSEEAVEAGETAPYSSGDGSSTQLERCAADMAGLVAVIAAHARSRDADFIVCPQNASEIIHDMPADGLPDWWSAIDAIGAEDTYFYGDLDMDNAWNPQADVLANLDAFLAQGKDVYCIEYLSASNGSAVDAFIAAASDRGYAWYAADRDLDTLR